MRSPRGLWVSSYFTFPRRFEKLGQLIDEILRKFGYEAARLEQVRLERFEGTVQVYHQPPIKLIVVYAERVYSAYADGFGETSTTPSGWSRAELTFFAPDYGEMGKICAAIREEIKTIKEKLRKRDKERRRKRKEKTRKNKEEQRITR